MSYFAQAPRFILPTVCNEYDAEGMIALNSPIALFQRPNVDDLLKIEAKVVFW